MKETSRSSGIKRNYLAETWKEYGGDFHSEDDFRKTVALWPVCPECGRRRTVRCPVCGHEGNLFPPGDVDFWNGVDEVPGKLTGPIASEFASGGCHCGSCGCDQKGSHHQKDRLQGGQETSEATMERAVTDETLTSEESSKSPLPAQSLLRPDSELYPGVRDWRKPLWNFSDSGEEIGLNGGDSPADNNANQVGDGVASADSTKESGTWEAPRPEESGILGADEKSFSVSNPNYYRRPMATIDLVLGESEPAESQKDPESETGSDFRGEKWPPKSRRGAALVVCPVCDEPFVPKYGPRCEGCDYVFDETADPESVSPPKTGDPSEPFTDISGYQVTIVLAALATLAVATILYFWRLGR